MSQGPSATKYKKVEYSKLKEWEYVCTDPLRQEAHIALKQEFDAAIEFARSDKLSLEEGLFSKRLGERYCYRFNVSQIIIQSYQADRPHRLEIGAKHVDGSIVSAGDGIIEIEVSSNFGNILHRVDIIFDLSVLLDLVDRRIVNIDREPKKWNTNIADELFTNLNFMPQSTLNSNCDHHNRLDKKPLKKDQQNVVNHLLQNSFSLIWGPPGTGKSHTLLAGLAEFLSNGKTVIFASNTNSAIDNVLEKIIGSECPYQNLSEHRDKGLIVRLGSQSSKKVMNVFSPKAIARLKSKEINEKLTELQNKLQTAKREIELTLQKINMWEQSQSKIDQYKKAIAQYKELPPISSLDNEINSLKERLVSYNKSYLDISTFLHDINREIPKLHSELQNFKKTSKAASALLQKNSFEKTNLLNELQSITEQIKDIENSRVKKWWKSQELNKLKIQSDHLKESVGQLEAQISSAEGSLRSATDKELGCIAKIQSITESISQHRESILKIHKVSDVLSKVIYQSEIDQNLSQHLLILLDYSLGSEIKDTLNLFLTAVERGWLYGRGNNPFTKNINKKIDDLIKRKNLSTELRTRILSMKEEAIEADKFIKNHAADYRVWTSNIDTLNEEIGDITSQITDYEKQLEELELSIISDARLLCLTMVKASYDRHFLDQRYDILVIDEYSMVSLPQLYCAAAIAKERIVLCGDHLQLPPICQSEQEIALKWMGQSIYEWHEGKHDERANRNPPGPTKLKAHMAMLTDQHRMPPEISHLIRPWYLKEEHNLKDDWNTNADQYIKDRSNHVLLENNVTLLDTTHTNCYSSRSAMKGRYNIVHAAIVAYLCKEFTKNHDIDPGKIICLTPYRQQSILMQTLFHQICPSIASYMAENTWTIHKSQGRGEPIIIYDLTDGKESNLSFFHKSTEPNLLNVAISRSKARIVILCSLKKMIHGLNTALESPLRSVFQKMAEIQVPVFDAKRYYESIFKCIDIQSIFSNGTIALTEAQKNGILVLKSKEYYEALSCDLVAARKSVTIVSPFITEARIDRIEPLLIQALQRSSGKLIIEIITRPPERMFDRYKDDLKRSAYIRRILDRLHDAGIKITLALNTHEKLVVIDERISYWGSLNPLSFKDTDEINTRLEAEGLAHKLLDFAVTGQSKPYKKRGVNASDEAIKESMVDLAKKELSDFAWTLAGYYKRPRMAFMYRGTIESLVNQPPKTVEGYFDIPEISKRHSVLRNHLSEIENIIYPIRGFKLQIDDHPSTSPSHSQLNLFDYKNDNKGNDILNSNNCESVPLNKFWRLGERPDPKMLNIKDFKKSIIEVLTAKQGKTCKRDILPDEVIRHLNVKTRGKPRKAIIQKIKQTITGMLKQKKLKEFTTTAGIKRIKLMYRTDE